MNTKRNYGRSRNAGIMPRRAEAERLTASVGADRSQPVERSAADFLPDRLSLKALRAAAAGCRGCELYRRATQTVFGEGRRDATLVLVGEQPGDQEDHSGRPFVGPAGRLLDNALQEAGIERDSTYITNAVKHFKWVARGKRRLHQRPREGEVDACVPWLFAELQVVGPQALVCLGATAARAAFGRAVRIKDYRGKLSSSRLAEQTLVTIHPSAILRLREPDRTREYRQLVADLKQVQRYSVH